MVVFVLAGNSSRFCLSADLEVAVGVEVRGGGEGERERDRARERCRVGVGGEHTDISESLCREGAGEQLRWLSEPGVDSHDLRRVGEPRPDEGEGERFLFSATLKPVLGDFG